MRATYQGNKTLRSGFSSPQHTARTESDIWLCDVCVVCWQSTLPWRGRKGDAASECPPLSAGADTDAPRVASPQLPRPVADDGPDSSADGCCRRDLLAGSRPGQTMQAGVEGRIRQGNSGTSSNNCRRRVSTPCTRRRRRPLVEPSAASSARRVLYSAHTERMASQHRSSQPTGYQCSSAEQTGPFVSSQNCSSWTSYSCSNFSIFSLVSAWFGGTGGPSLAAAQQHSTRMSHGIPLRDMQADGRVYKWRSLHCVQ